MRDNIETTPGIPVSTPIPGVLGWRFYVPKTDLRQAMMPTIYETTYAACSLPNKVRLDEFGEHVFCGDEDEGMYHTFLFMPDRSTSRTTVIPSLSPPISQEHYWKSCLLELGALEDATQPLNFEVGGVTTEVPRLFGRMHLLPGGNYASEIDVETFVSDRPFTREEMGRLEEQVTTRLQWQGRNLSVDLDCLHGLVEFPETNESGTPLSGWGTVNKPLVLNGKTVYPPTSMPKWRRYLFRQSHELVGGMWRLTNYYANPPAGARKILNAAV